MRLPNIAYTTRPWRIHEIAPDFTLEDVWELPTPGGPDDLSRLVQQMTSGSNGEHSSRLYDLLFEVRWKLGDLLGWDKSDQGVGERVRSLRNRLPADLRDGPRGPDFRGVPFTAVYLTDTEFVAETANGTVHALMHLGWVPDQAGGYRGQMATLVKPNGLLGKAYLAGITPVRRLVVSPALTRKIGRGWQSQAGNPTTGISTIGA
ncbi:DUF2867 domain-containing protein [Nonomuraea sp. NPDC005983]|uniref:DUF2867 domain-containing protein n=1 Tax=Nonomuraea sp. NPDC005983 TaxID=3155595 RepID=UPI0033BA2983